MYKNVADFKKRTKYDFALLFWLEKMSVSPLYRFIQSGILYNTDLLQIFRYFTIMKLIFP